MRKIVALAGGCLFFFLIFSMYLVLDQFGKGSEEEDLFIKVSVVGRPNFRIEIGPTSPNVP